MKDYTEENVALLIQLQETLVVIDKELQALRAWKEKARPFLEKELWTISDALAMNQVTGIRDKELDELVTEEMENNHKQLTELLEDK